MSVKSYIDTDGNNYWIASVNIRSKVNPKIRIQKKVSKLKSKMLALKEEKRLIALVSREISKLDGQGLIWKDLLEFWEADLKKGFAGKVSTRSIYDYTCMINTWTKCWNKRFAYDLSKADGKELLLRLAKEGLSQAYIKKIKNLVNRVFKYGIENRHIPASALSPVEGLSINKGEEKIPEILSMEEIKILLQEARDQGHFWYPVWVVALNTGMRSGELYALRWDHIDLEKNIITCHESFNFFTKSIGPTKGRYWRTIPISERLREFLIEHKARSNTKFVFDRTKTWDNGEQALYLKEFCLQISITPIKFHTLRACFATQMLASGVSAATVMRIGGWKRSSTMDIYLRLAGVDVKGATNSIQDIIPKGSSYRDNVISLF